VDPVYPPKYSTSIVETESLLRALFARGEAVQASQDLEGNWVARASRFFQDPDPDKRHYDYTATFEFATRGLTLPHAVALVAVVNGINDLKEAEWQGRWAMVCPLPPSETPPSASRGSNRPGDAL
jgi:hypothetical protein